VTIWLLAAAFFALGVQLIGALVVRKHPLFWKLDEVASETLFAHGTPIARILTLSGYSTGITIALIAGALVAAIWLPGRLPFIAVLAVAQSISQLVARRVKAAYARERPEHWLFRHEYLASYPSGHASSAVVVYGAFALMTATAPWPAAVRLGATTILLLWTIGIGWSRVALGAHYLSDVLGGYFFGAATLCLVFAVGSLPALPAALRFTIAG